jgi:hypothetical protein
MKPPSPTLLIVGLLLVGASINCFSQVPLPGQPGPGRPVTVQPPPGRPVTGQMGLPVRPGASFNSPSEPTAPDMLSTNYQVTFSAVADGKALGELTMLTCSPQVSVSGPLNSGPTPTNFTVSGSLAEKEGDLLFTYGIGFRYPVTTAMTSPAPGAPPVTSNIEYQEHSSQGMLRMKVGTQYEVLKAAGVIYTIIISTPQKK